MWKHYFTPETLDNALQLLQEYNGRSQIIAGGTDLVLELEAKKTNVIDVLVDVSKVPELCEITRDGDTISIGAAITFSEIQRSELLADHAKLLVDAMPQIAGTQIRNVATIGGNVVNGSPAADTVPMLLVLDAFVSTKSLERGERKIPITEFLVDYRKVDLLPGEIVTGFHFQIPELDARFCFRKVQLRRSMAIAVLNLAILLNIKDNKILNVKIAMGAVAPTAVRIPSVENALENLPANEIPNSKIFSSVADDISPISDYRASYQYRLNVAQNLLQEEIYNLLVRERVS